MTRPADTSVELVLPFSTSPTLRKRFMVLNEPVPANLRFGLALEVLDKLAEDTATAYVHRSEPSAKTVTAAVDNIVVRTPADVARDMVFHARINFVGRSSMEVGIRVEQPGDPPVHIASCYFTMVARTGEGDEARSLPVPALEYVDDMERLRYRKAQERRENYRRLHAVSVEPPSRDEYERLNELHAAQEAPDFSGLLAGDLVTGSWERMYPEQENIPQKIFGGHLINRSYELAAICAEEVAPDRAVPIAVNRINFLSPVRMGDKLHYRSRVVYTGHTSVCVEASIERVSLDRTTKALSNTCVYTFVNVDENLVRRPVLPVYPTTYAEDARYLTAHRRNERHRSRKSLRVMA